MRIHNCFNYTSNTHKKYTRVSSCINYFCPFIEITNCKNRLNIKSLRHGIFVNLLKSMLILKTIKFKINISYLKNILSTGK